MSVLMALKQNCKIANATSNSTAVILTENDILGAALERRKPAKVRRSLSSLELVFWAHYEYGEFSLAKKTTQVLSGSK